ncbi:MAG: hypothetical protein N4Q30_05900 [Neisseriaceae bacterium]|nr:hypothetical protein [Neisseriaceae bacterium]
MKAGILCKIIFCFISAGGLLLYSACTSSEEEPYPQKYMNAEEKAALAQQSPEEKAERKRYACATVGSGHVVKIPKEYLTSWIHYVGVDYWGGKGWRNFLLWCNDRASAISIGVKWPELTPVGGEALDDESNNSVMYIYHSITNAQTQNKRNPHATNEIHQDNITDLRYYWRQVDQPVPKDLKLTIVYRKDLGLYQASLNTTLDEDNLTKLYKKYYYWHQDVQGNIDFMAKCTDYQLYNSSCRSSYDPPDEEMYMDIYHPMRLLKDWRQLEQKGWELVQYFQVKKGE